MEPRVIVDGPQVVWSVVNLILLVIMLGVPAFVLYMLWRAITAIERIAAALERRADQ